MSIFSARTDAWRSDMERGQETLDPPVADEHGGKTHKCDGCSDGAPCSSCGGNISRTSPAYQALGWGMMQSGSMSDPFWIGATVGQAVADARGPKAGADWNAVASVVQRAQAIQYAKIQGQSASLALVEAWPSSKIALASGDDGGGQPVPGEPKNDPVVTEDANFTSLEVAMKEFINRANVHTPDEVYDSGLECCVLNFAYPFALRAPEVDEESIKYPHTSPTDKQQAFSVRRFFSFTAEFIPKIDIAACDCLCCTFRQIVMQSEMIYNIDGSQEIEHDSVTSGADFCRWSRKKEDGDGYDHYKGPRSEPPSGEGWEGPYCLGDHNQGSAPGFNGYSSNGCRFLGTDRPSQPTFVNSSWTWMWYSIGMIVDRCNNNAVKAIDFLKWSIGGVTTENGASVTKVTDG